MIKRLPQLKISFGSIEIPKVSSDLSNIHFDQCKFINQSFKNIKISNVYFYRCTFINCDFTDALYDKFTLLEECIFDTCKGLNLDHIKIIELTRNKNVLENLKGNQ